MTATRRAVTKPDDGVDMQAWLAIIPLRDIANGAEHLALFPNRNLSIGFLLEIKPTHRCPFKAPSAVKDAPLM
jgi:hypothetical protein